MMKTMSAMETISSTSVKARLWYMNAFLYGSPVRAATVRERGRSLTVAALKYARRVSVPRRSQTLR
jgi:hypothetical protein